MHSKLLRQGGPVRSLQVSLGQKLPQFRMFAKRTFSQLGVQLSADPRRLLIYPFFRSLNLYAFSVTLWRPLVLADRR